MDLPAPVSPVRTFSPGPNRTSIASTIAKPEMRRVVSMATMIHGALTLRKYSVVHAFPAPLYRSPQRSFARRMPKKSMFGFRTSRTRL